MSCKHKWKDDPNVVQLVRQVEKCTKCGARRELVWNIQKGEFGYKALKK